MLPALLAAGLVVGGAAWATGSAERAPGVAPRVGNALVAGWQERGDNQAGGLAVLGGERTPGTPSIQRQRHDDVVFTVTVAPARPGPNLVRVDVTKLQRGASHHATADVRVGTAADDQQGAMPLAEDRPGADGRWAVVDLPEGSGTVLVTHGRWHRIPFMVDTGTVDDAGGGAALAATAATWTGADGPECLTDATAEVLAGARPDTSAEACPAAALDDDQADALRSSVAFLAGRGVEELALRRDQTPRSTEAADVVEEAAAAAGVAVVDPASPPGPRNALLVVSGWQDAAGSLAAESAKPLEQQAIRSDGTWLAPWLLTPGVVDSTPGAMLPLEFDIRSEEAKTYSQALTGVLQGQAPTASGFAAWLASRGETAASPGRPALFAASRAAFMPDQPGHAAHGTEVSWFPGGTVTPVGSLTPSPTIQEN